MTKSTCQGGRDSAPRFLTPSPVLVLQSTAFFIPPKGDPGSRHGPSCLLESRAQTLSWLFPGSFIHSFIYSLLSKYLLSTHFAPDTGDTALGVTQGTALPLPSLKTLRTKRALKAPGCCRQSQRMNGQLKCGLAIQWNIMQQEKGTKH